MATPLGTEIDRLRAELKTAGTAFIEERTAHSESCMALNEPAARQKWRSRMGLKTTDAVVVENEKLRNVIIRICLTDNGLNSDNRLAALAALKENEPAAAPASLGGLTPEEEAVLARTACQSGIDSYAAAQWCSHCKTHSHADAECWSTRAAAAPTPPSMLSSIDLMTGSGGGPRSDTLDSLRADRDQWRESSAGYATDAERAREEIHLLAANAILDLGNRANDAEQRLAQVEAETIERCAQTCEGTFSPFESDTGCCDSALDKAAASIRALAAKKEEGEGGEG